MGFWNTLGEAASTFGGDEASAERFARVREHKQQLSEQELESQTQQILGDVGKLNERRAALDPNSPTYQKDVKTLDQALHDARQVFTDLYHPAKNPGALSKLHGFIQAHIGRGKNKQATTPAPTPAAARQSMSDRISAIDASAYAPTPGLLSYPQEQQAARIKAGIDPRAGTEKETPTKYQPQLTETTDAQGQKHHWRVPLEAGAPPEEVDFKGQAVTPKGTAAGGKPKKGWSRDADGRYFSVLLDPQTNQPMPNTKNYDDLPPSSVSGRISVGSYHFVDEKGQVHQVQETRASAPAGQSIPKTPAAAKDRVIGFKGNKDYNDTKSSYEAATDRTKTMEENLKNALNGDQQAMLSLVANHIGMTLGAQKGARITRAVWDEAVASTPWLQKIEAKWSSDGFLSGVTLAPEQMKQMVRLAHEKTQVLKEHLDRLDVERGAAPASTGDPTDNLVKELTDYVKSQKKPK